MRGVVREWHADEGWGVVDAPGAPGGCWAHFSSIATDGYRALQVGQAVDVDIEAVDQEGYAFRAVELRPAGATPPPPDRGDQRSAAYRSTLTIRYDDGSTFRTEG